MRNSFKITLTEAESELKRAVDITRWGREAVTFSCRHCAWWGPSERDGQMRGVIMNFSKQRGPNDIDRPEAEIEGNIRELVRRDSTALRQVGSESELAASSLSTLLRRVSGNSTREIDNLISELRLLREKLQADGSRVERDIVEYAALSQSVIQLTKVIAEGVTHVKKVDAPSISE
jgi:hypothetical protein